MGKLPENYEDWRIPDFLSDPENIDVDKVGRLVFNARKAEENALDQAREKDEKLVSLQADLDAALAGKAGTDEEAQTELKALRKENRTLTENAAKPNPDHQKEIDRLATVIDLVDQGLPKALALRVQGDDAEALIADGKSLAATVGIDLDDPSGDGGNDGAGGQNQPPGQRPVPGQYRSGLEGRKPVSTPSDPVKASVNLPPLY